MAYFECCVQQIPWNIPNSNLAVSWLSWLKYLPPPTPPNNLWNSALTALHMSTFNSDSTAFNAAMLNILHKTQLHDKTLNCTMHFKGLEVDLCWNLIKSTLKQLWFYKGSAYFLHKLGVVSAYISMLWYESSNFISLKFYSQIRPW